jgi:hypothetical protein
MAIDEISDPVSIAFRLTGHGWARFTLRIGHAAIEVGAFGYCTDALGDLVRAALMIATSGRYAEASFDGEPREWRLLNCWSHSGSNMPPRFGSTNLIAPNRANVKPDQLASSRASNRTLSTSRIICH